MTVYTDGISFYHHCLGDADLTKNKQGYYSAFYISTDLDDYVRCFYDRCTFKLPRFMYFGNKYNNNLYGFWITESGKPEVFNMEDFDKNIYKPIEI